MNLTWTQAQSYNISPSDTIDIKRDCYKKINTIVSLKKAKKNIIDTTAKESKYKQVKIQVSGHRKKISKVCDQI